MILFLEDTYNQKKDYKYLIALNSLNGLVYMYPCYKKDNRI